MNYKPSLRLSFHMKQVFSIQFSICKPNIDVPRGTYTKVPHGTIQK